LKKIAKLKFTGIRSALKKLDDGELERLYELHKKMAASV